MRVLIADDHPLTIVGIRSALEDDGIEVVGEAYSGRQVLPLVRRTNPDVVLLDMRMPDMDGLSCLELIRARHPEVKVVALSMFDDPSMIEGALRCGASGYIVKTVKSTDIPAALRQAVEGTLYTAVGRAVLEQSPAKSAGLSDRELSVLAGVGRGLTNQAIAKELWLSPETVKFHLANIYRKLGVANRTEAARYAYRHGLIGTASPADDLLDGSSLA